MINQGKVVSFINMKGGVGKTTLCKEMATYMSTHILNDNEKPYKILLIDIDPQSNLTQALDERYQKGLGDMIFRKKYEEDYEPEIIPSIQNIFNPPELGNVVDWSIINLKDNLDLVPGELETIFLERSQNNSTANKLLDFIEDNKLKDEYDFIFIDCPPTYSIYTEMAFFCSDYYYIPVVPDAYSTLGVDLLQKVVKDIIKEHRNTVFKNKAINNLGIVFSRVDLTNKPKQSDYIEAMKELDIVKENDIYIFRNKFKESNKVSTAQFDKLISDREDTALINMLESICIEFINRMVDINEE